MSRFTELFENHSIHDALKQNAELLSTVEGMENLMTEQSEEYLRLKQVYDYTYRVLSNLDPNLVPSQLLDSLVKQINVQNQEITNFISNRNNAHLVNANNYASNSLVQLGYLISTTTSSDVADIQSSVIKLRKSASQSTRRIEEEAVEAIKEVSKLSNLTSELYQQVNSQRERVDKTISEFQSQFSEAEDRRRQENTDSAKVKDSEFTNLINSSQSEFNELKNNTGDEVKAFIDDTNKQLESTKTELLHNADDIIKKMKERNKEAANLLQIATNIGVTGNYKQSATDERKIADGLRKLAFFFMSLMVISVGLIVVLAIKEFDWTTSIFRLLATLILAIPAFYAVRESNKHRKFEQKSRKFELELASINPFLETLPESQRNGIKEELAKKFFGQHETLDEKEEIHLPYKDLFDFVKSLASKS